jgi:acyltransferase
MRIKSIDVAKGVLILLVIIGHILLGGPATFLHYIIYSFHMPLFIALSGYLVNWGNLQKLSFGGLGKKYLYRVIIPWVFAVIVYGMVSGVWTIKPYFHLWFIPAYLSWIVISWFLLKSGLTIRKIFITSIFLSAGCFFLRYDLPLSDGGLPRLSGGVADALLATFRPDYYIFFALGGFLKNYKKAPAVGMALLLSLLLFIGEILLFYYPNPYLSFILFFVFNGCLTCLMVSLIERRRSSGNSFLEWVGRNSLGIYLWHVLPILVAFRYVTEGPIVFYSLAIALEAAFFAFVFYTEKIAFVRKYFYGLESDTILGHRRSIT